MLFKEVHSSHQTAFCQCRTWYKAGKSEGPGEYTQSFPSTRNSDSSPPVYALWPGSCLHAVRTLMSPRWEGTSAVLLQ